MLASTKQTLAELRRQLVAPAQADLPRIAEQVSGIAAGLSHWMDRFHGRRDQASRSCMPAGRVRRQLDQLTGLGAEHSPGIAFPGCPPPVVFIARWAACVCSR